MGHYHKKEKQSEVEATKIGPGYYNLTEFSDFNQNNITHFNLSESTLPQAKRLDG